MLSRFLLFSSAWFVSVLVGCDMRATSAPETADASVSEALLMPGPDGRLVPMARGKLKVFLFVRVDCPIANRFAPEIQRLQKEYADDVSWWLVYPNPRLASDQLRSHLSEYGYECEAFHDQQMHLVKQTGASITPEAAVYSADNTLVYCGRINDQYTDFGKSRPAPTRHDLELALQAARVGETMTPLRQPAIGCYIRDLAP